MRKNGLAQQKSRAVGRVYEALARGDYIDAGIRISQGRLSGHHPGFDSASQFLRKVFDDTEPRNNQGRWSGDGSDSSHSSKTVVTDPYCMIVKKLCIVEATAELPTGDYGISFFRALNACMDRHGCLGRA